MAKKYNLEAFDAGFPGECKGIAPSASLVEAERLQIFEQGYRSGWDDAISSQERHHSEMLSEISGNICGLSFTYQEAKSHLLEEMKCVVKRVFEVILPDLVSKVVPEIVFEKIDHLVSLGSIGAISISVNPSSKDVLESLLPASLGFPVRFLEEETLGVGQVFLSFGEGEELVDLDAAALEIKKLISDFFDDVELLRKGDDA